jgi:hypothetical protein
MARKITCILFLTCLCFAAQLNNLQLGFLAADKTLGSILEGGWVQGVRGLLRWSSYMSYVHAHIS